MKPLTGTVTNSDDPDENVGEHRISSGSKQFANIKAIFKDINIIMRKGGRALRGYFGPPMRSKNKSWSSQVSSY